MSKNPGFWRNLLQDHNCAISKWNEESWWKGRPRWCSRFRLFRARPSLRRCPGPQTFQRRSPPTVDIWNTVSPGTDKVWCWITSNLWRCRIRREGGRGCGSQSCADEFTCQSWRSVPAWQNRCWPSSSQKWTSSCECIKKKKDRRSRFCSSLRILAGAALISAMTAAIHTYTMFTQWHVFGGEAGGNEMR